MGIQLYLILKFFCFCLSKYFKKLGTTYKFKYVKYDSEFDMMYNFFNTMVPKMSVMTGWNFVNYDWIYLVNRSRKLKKKINGKEITIATNKVIIIEHM